MVVEREVDPVVDEEAERIVNPRPSNKRFSSLASRSAEHDRLYREGIRELWIGAVEKAIEHFVAAYALQFSRTTLLSLVNIQLKRGNVELAVACYRKMLQSDMIRPHEKMQVMGKLHEALGQWGQVRDIIEASQAGKLNSPQDREKRAAALSARAHAANEEGKYAAAEADFLEVWRLTFRPPSLISAANMMAHQKPRMRLSASLYYALLRSNLAPEDRSLVERKLAEVHTALAMEWRKEYAATVLQRTVRGRLARANIALKIPQMDDESRSGRRAKGKALGGYMLSSKLINEEQQTLGHKGRQFHSTRRKVLYPGFEDVDTGEGGIRKTHEAGDISADRSSSDDDLSTDALPSPRPTPTNSRELGLQGMVWNEFPQVPRSPSESIRILNLRCSD